MEILTIINKVLDLKIVQWALLVSTVALGATLVLKMITISYLRIENGSLKNQAADLTIAIDVQNRKIQELAATTKSYQDNFQNKQREATRLALETNEMIKGISTIPFTKDCSSNLDLGIEYIQTNIKEE